MNFKLRIRAQFLILLFLALGRPHAHATGGGTTNGNHSDIVTCDGVDIVLDLLLANDLDKPLLPDSSSTPAVVMERLRTHFPLLALSYADFLVQAKTMPLVGRRIWHASGLTIASRREPEILHRLPQGCRSPNGTSYDVKQAFYRSQSAAPGGSVHYYAHIPTLRAFASRSPLQESMIMVHEWLWDVLADADLVRQFNSFLHGKRFAAASRDDARAYARALANFRPQGTDPVAPLNAWLDLEEELFSQSGNAQKQVLLPVDASGLPVLLAPGTELSWTLVLQPQVLEGSKFSGANLLFRTRSVEPGTLELKVSSGPFLSTPRTLVIGPASSETTPISVRCEDSLCSHATGILADLVVQGRPVWGNWTLRIRNPGSKPLVLIPPTLVLQGRP